MTSDLLIFAFVGGYIAGIGTFILLATSASRPE